MNRTDTPASAPTEMQPAMDAGTPWPQTLPAGFTPSGFEVRHRGWGPQFESRPVGFAPSSGWQRVCGGSVTW